MINLYFLFFLVIFTEIFERIGAKNVKVEEVYSLDEEEFIQRGFETYGLIFLFKWDPRIVSEGSPLSPQDCYFAHQKVKDACATQAIVSSAMTNNAIEKNEELQTFFEITREFSPEARIKFVTFRTKDMQLVQMMHLE